MPNTRPNPFRGTGLPNLTLYPTADASAVGKLLSMCPAHAQTPLVEAPELAKAVGVARITIKDERGRMGLGSIDKLYFTRNNNLLLISHILDTGL